MQGDEIGYIVERLNDPPFSLSLTMVAFDEKSPFELLEIVNALMAQLSKEHQTDLRDETPEATANRMLDFLRVLNYKINMEQQHAKQALLHGDPQIIYPILTWMLQRMPELQKRAYLARFLVNLEVPEHMFTDEEVVEVYQNYKDLQEEFKEHHKTSEKYKSQLISPTEIKKAIMQMEEDKSMLETKVEGLQTKLSSTERFDQMLDASHKLRLQQDEQVKLQDRLKEQKAQLMQTEHRLNSMGSQLNEKRQERAQSADVQALLGKLERECAELERSVLETLPQEIGAKQRRMDELQGLLSEGASSEGDLQHMAAQQQQLLRAVQQLEERKRATLNKPDDKLAMFRQQASLVGKKKEQVHQRLTSLARERSAIEAELDSKAESLAAVKGRPVLKGDDFRKYAQELRGKTAQYKRMKAELSELRAEWGVLSRTEGLLRAQDKSISARLGEAEARRGLEGFGQTQEQLETVSQQKAEVDEAKGRTLEEMSQVVGEINTQIKSRKSRLAPQIKELRALRGKVQELESEYLEKKGLYDNTKAGLDSDVGKVQAEAESAQKEAAHEESACHYYESASSIEEVKLQRAADERAGNFRRTMPDGSVINSYKALYAGKIKQQEGASKELRERQKRIKENHAPNARQVQMFKNLHKLLRCKMDVQKMQRAEAEDLGRENEQDTNIFTMAPDAPDEVGYDGGYPEQGAEVAAF